MADLLSCGQQAYASPALAPSVQRHSSREIALPVVETFHSLQGEGIHAGRSAFFIRLAGCNVGCSWCDTRHSWPAADHPALTLAELAEATAAAAAAGAGFAVITGGEPLEHNLDPLCAALAAACGPLPLHLETSGAAPLHLSGRFAWITLSPKRHRPPSPVLLAACHELKVVVHEPADLAFAEAMAAQAIRARQHAALKITTAPGRSSDPQHGTGQATASGQTTPAGHATRSDQAACSGQAASSGQTLGFVHATASEQPSASGPATPAGHAIGCDPTNAAAPTTDHAAPSAGSAWASAAVQPPPSCTPGAAQLLPLTAPALLLQPGWNCRRGQELAIAFVQRHPAWRISLQSHKWLGVR